MTFRSIIAQAGMPRVAHIFCTVAKGTIQHWEQYTDEDLPDETRDTASSAMLAYAGGGDVEPDDPERRLKFWEWWLGEAIPTAWEQAAR